MTDFFSSLFYNTTTRDTVLIVSETLVVHRGFVRESLVSVEERTHRG